MMMMMMMDMFAELSRGAGRRVGKEVRYIHRHMEGRVICMLIIDYNGDVAGQVRLIGSELTPSERRPRAGGRGCLGGSRLLIASDPCMVWAGTGWPGKRAGSAAGCREEGLCG